MIWAWMTLAIYIVLIGLGVIAGMRHYYIAAVGFSISFGAFLIGFSIGSIVYFFRS